ncbi:DUF2730 family protein [Azospirillum sp. A39]|uniref:DUF2730 family protein n=1 Tax=Azospirillum sp. A39 TaxID=3462279 RepID=UPI0040455D7E
MTDDVVKWGWAIVLVINLLLGWVVWSLRSGFVPRRDFEVIAMRVALIEEKIQHLPTQRDFAVLRDDVAKLTGKSDATEQVLAGIASAVRRIEDYLLKAKA